MSFELEEAISYYRRQGAPGDQTALVGLLREISDAHSGIPRHMIPAIAQALNTKESFLLAVIRRIPSLRLSDTHTLELCAGPNCPKRADLASFVEKNWGRDPANFTLKYVPCMRMCGKGPNIRWDGTVYHQADEALLRRLIEGGGDPE